MRPSPEDIIQAIYDAAEKGLRVLVVSGGGGGTVELGPTSLAALEEIQVNVTGEGGLSTEATLAAVLASLEQHRQDVDGRLADLLGAYVGGALLHRELWDVPASYSAAQCKMTFPEPKRHLRMWADQDAFWVHSAAGDAEAATKLATQNERGYLPDHTPLDIVVSTGITRLDFISETTAADIYVTAT